MSIMNNKLELIKISAQYDSRKYKEFKLSFSRFIQKKNNEMNTKKNSKEIVAAV